MRRLLLALLLVPGLALAQATSIVTTDTVQSGCVLNAANATCQVSMKGKTSAGFIVTAISSPTGIVLVQESSRDGTSWDAHPFADVSLRQCFSVVPNASLAVGYGKSLVLGGGDRFVRVRAAAWTSGSVTVSVNATDTIMADPCPSGVDAGYVTSGVSTATGLILITGPQSCTGAYAPWACCTAANTGATCVVNLMSVVASASVASTTTTDQMLNIKYGTGATCGTGTTYLMGAFAPANGGFAWVGGTQAPIRVPAGNNVCWMHAAAGSKIVNAAYFVSN